MEYSIEKIKEILPHRYPFLLVDRVISVVAGPDPKSREGRVLEALKNVTINEEFFNGHFPGRPVMPGVLILEAMAQVGALAHHIPNDPESEFMIVSVNNVKFRYPVVPGDQLIIRGKILKSKSRIKCVSCTTRVDGRLVAEAEILAVIQSKQVVKDQE